MRYRQLAVCTVLLATCALAAAAPALSGERLILDPGTTTDTRPSQGAGGSQGAGAGDVDARVRELEEQKAAVDSKGPHSVTLDVSGTVAGQVQAIHR